MITAIMFGALGEHNLLSSDDRPQYGHVPEKFAKIEKVVQFSVRTASSRVRLGCERERHKKAESGSDDP